MYIIIAGAGKVGWNLARELIGEGHEVTLIESDRNRYLTVEEELEHNVQHGDASELWVLERAGIVRADMVVAVTGDDEDNMLISPGREGEVPGRAHDRARQQPAQPGALRAARRAPGGVRDRPDPAPDRARGPAPRPRAPARPAPGAARDHRAGGGRRTRPPPASRSASWSCRTAAWSCRCCATAPGFVPKADTADRGRRRGARGAEPRRRAGGVRAVRRVPRPATAPAPRPSAAPA